MAAATTPVNGHATYAGPFAALINPAARANGIDPFLLAALIKVESDFGRNNGPSSAGAVGPVQIQLSSHPDVSYAQAMSPAFAIPWAARYLAALKRAAGGSTAGALRAYNTGSSKPSGAGTAYVDQVDAAYRELTGRRSTSSATPSTPAGYASPIASDAKFGRIDQGVDYSQSEPYPAIGAGTVYAIGSGFAGGTGKAVYYRLDQPLAGQSEFYVAETTPLVKVGDRVTAGQPIASGGSAELGFAHGASPLAPLVGGLGAGTQATGPGHRFKALADALAGNNPPAAAGAQTVGFWGDVGQGAITAIPGIGPVLGLAGLLPSVGLPGPSSLLPSPTTIERLVLYVVFLGAGVALIWLGVRRLFDPGEEANAAPSPASLAIFQQAPGAGAKSLAAELPEAALLA